MIKKILTWVSFYIISVLFVGIFTLDIHFARSFTIFIAVTICFLGGLYVQQKVQMNSMLKLYLISSLGFSSYAAIALFVDIHSWHIGPVVCFLSYSFGFLFGLKKLSVFYFILIICIFAYYSFLWYPQREFIVLNLAPNKNQRIINRSDTAIVFKDAFGKNNFDAFSNKVILIETWNEYCGACFQAMKGLHPFLKVQESNYKNFKHIYLYSLPQRGRNKEELDTKKVFENKHLPYEDMTILYDESQNFYNKYLPEGFPHFILIDQKGNVVFSFQGYSDNFKPAYKRYIKTKLREVFENHNTTIN